MSWIVGLKQYNGIRVCLLGTKEGSKASASLILTHVLIHLFKDQLCLTQIDPFCFAFHVSKMNIHSF